MTPNFGLWQRISGDGPVAIIAEAGVNHDGSVTDAHLLIEVAARCGADAVKFQTFRPTALVAERAPTARYQAAATGSDRQLEMISSLALPDGCWTELRDHARGLGLEFISTPFDIESALLLVALGMPLIKVPSGELTNLPFIRSLSRLGHPLLISTGMSDMLEVSMAFEAAAEAPGIGLMHCVSAYPAPDNQCNVRAVKTLQQRFRVPIGWSDHTIGAESAIAAVSLGASVLEKHITLDRTRRGPDHSASADPEMFNSYIAAIRRTEQLLGTGVKEPQRSEADIRLVARRSWHTLRALDPGHCITDDDVVALRPAEGIPPSVDVVGRRIREAIARGEPLMDAALDD